MAVAVAFTVKFLIDTDNTGFDPHSPDFALYKNSRFQECLATVPPDAATCSDIQANLLSLDPNNYPQFTDQGISVVVQPYLVSRNRTAGNGNDPATYGWCQAVSCLAGFQIVPSTPRGSAFMATPLSAWCAVALTLFTTLWQFRQRNAALLRPEKEGCRGLRSVAWYDWVFHAYDLCSFVWWWVSFARYVANPAFSSTPSSLSWVTPWKFAVLIQYHPYSCAFNKRPKTLRALSRSLGTLAVLHWIATAYAMHTNRTSILMSRPPFQAYDCAVSQIPGAPGVSTCSPDRLCSKAWLFHDPGFRYKFEALASGSYILAYFIVFTLAAVFPLLAALLVPVINNSSSRPWSMRQAMQMVKEAYEGLNVGPTVTLAIAAGLGGIVFGSLFTADVIRWNSAGREAPLTIYPECHAVHVALSPWRFYLDVDDYQKGLRVAKMWFNA